EGIFRNGSVQKDVWGRAVAVKRVNIATIGEFSRAREEANKLIRCNEHINILCNFTLKDWVLKQKGFAINISDLEILQRGTKGLAHLHRCHRTLHRNCSQRLETSKYPFSYDKNVYIKLVDFELRNQLQEDKSATAVTSSSGTEGWMPPKLLQMKENAKQVIFQTLAENGQIFLYWVVFFTISYQKEYTHLPPIAI
ncbi:Serine/threonine-protein kinase/endoribonuclease IRE1, partial [Orchesella cincta]